MKITPSTPFPGASIVATARRRNAVYWPGWCRALGLVGPSWSQLHDATISWAPVWRIRSGIAVGQFAAVTSPKPSMVLGATTASPVACSAAEMPKDASYMTESPSTSTRQRVSRCGRRGQVDRQLALVVTRAGHRRGRATLARCVVPTTLDGSATAGTVATTMATAVAHPASGAPQTRAQPCSRASLTGRSTR